MLVKQTDGGLWQPPDAAQGRGESRTAAFAALNGST